MKASIMKTNQDMVAVATSPARNGSASPQRAGAPVLRDLHGWYRWLRRDQWLHVLTGRGQLTIRAQFADRPLLGWPRREEWLRATWKTRLWWFRQDYLGTPLKDCTKSHEMTRRYGALVARQHGISVARQVAEQVWLRLRYGLPPDVYYSFRLFLPRFRRQASAFIQWKELGPLHLQLNCRTCSGEARVLKDKARFATWCTARGVPTVPVLASFENGQVTPHVWDGGEAPLPRRDLFSKNADQGWGLESTRWRHVGAGRYEGAGGEVSQDGLLETLRERSSKMALILQECYANHASIAGLSSGGLSTIRLVTMRLPGGAPEPLFAAMRMPTGGSAVDNFSTSGLGAPIDLETGRLGSALPKYPHAGSLRYTHHPDTGHPIAGFQLPRWNEIIELGLRAHEAFPEMPSVGWDIAFTERGLLVLEGNEGWGADVIQITHERPLRDTLFQPYYDAWMQHCLKTE